MSRLCDGGAVASQSLQFGDLRHTHMLPQCSLDLQLLRWYWHLVDAELSATGWWHRSRLFSAVGISVFAQAKAHTDAPL